MSRYETCFARLKADNQGAFVPFVTLGDPTPEQSLEVIKALIDGGADALELGLPFSDPVADGPVIQRANLRALDAGTNFSDILKLLKAVRDYSPQIPIGLLVYANLIYAKGVHEFYQQMKDVGVDSVLIADVPTKEAKRFAEIAKDVGIDAVFIAPPDASDALLQTIATECSGYVYLLSRSGVTGAETQMQAPASELINKLKNAGAPPILLGFGISQPEHVQKALAAGANGAISGSAVVALIEKNLDNNAQQLADLKAFTQSMKAATSLK
ncbi:tryptophan synthase subunit alpha [Idiomarina sp. WRN-38]|uniref:tryptophan synthase subunit alpha n=1 Tax=Idiomarina sp. OXR-189 TaxID=3100175 RepID=UPI0007334E01|nr:tryptophan synthase subunit alpha [Idiomarina sp. OXR-189]KTG23277.1 tryptophan synthase subunit alpha [Idiomarina sp. H105]OAE90670.1 tryptophan synthase subunit alpha [Idiomarina sp. WRN-38]WPZ00575.1 tryptophan synthase subunit alpha [Idiomarina sp. OXR-189]